VKSSLPLLLLAGLAAAAEPSVELTIYNDDVALVKDRRSLELAAGRQSLPWEGVAQTLFPSSASFSSPSAKSLEQDYRYDLVSRGVLLRKYLGKEVTLVVDTAQGKPGSQVSGRVLSVEGDRITSLEVGRKILLDPPGRVVLPSLPEGLLVKPTLVMDLWSAAGGKVGAELRYLCSGITWSADYVAVVDSADGKFDLDGLVTLNNRSGTEFHDAKLKLVAGNVNHIPDQRQARIDGYLDNPSALYVLDGKKGAKAAREPAGFQEEGLFEYHLYELGRPVTVLENAQKQVSLLSARGAGMNKRFVFDESYDARYWWWNHGEDTKEGRKLAVILDVPNTEKNRLGMALPKGRVRVYKADRSGSLQYLGEDEIGHTAKEDTLHLALGQAFDLFGKRVVESSKQSNQERTETIAVTVHNSKDEAVEAEVVEHQNAPNWKAYDASQSFAKKDASTLVFNVKVPAHGETTVRYTCESSWK
jgi:hypothetical protein